MKQPIKEIALFIITLLPFGYFSLNYQALPDRIPIHFNYEGVADDFASKSGYIWVMAAINIGLYLLMLVLPKLDPRKRMDEMGDKYFRLRLVLTLFFSALMCYVLYASLPGHAFRPNMLLAIIAGLFAMLGNYFQTIRPNYFVGIRTPWTLENEEIWKKVHRQAGILWMGAGSLLFVLAFFVQQDLFSALFLSAVALMVLLPVVQSYVLSKKLKS